MATVVHLIWSLFVLVAVRGGNVKDRGFYGNRFGIRENPLSLFELEGARQMNKFTGGGLYRTTFSEYSAVSSYAISALKMGIYITDDIVNNGALLEYSVTTAGLQTQSTGVNNCSGIHLFDVQGKLYGNFFAMKIKPNRLLTEERCESYLLNVEAKIDKRTVDATQVFIQARLSVNFKPSFNKTRISKTIPNNFPLFQQIMQLKTKDIKDFGRVYFSLVQESNYFLLNPVNGMLFLMQSLPPQISRFDLVAVVTKWDGKPNVQNVNDDRTCKITINVKNVNLYAPSIHVKVLHTKLGDRNKQTVATITVNDSDKGINGKIERLSILSGNENGNFRLERVNPGGPIFKLHLVKSLNSHHCFFRLTFEAKDRGDPPLATTLLHRFILKRALLRKNSFVEDKYVVEISEMMPVNYTIIDLKPPNLESMSNMSCTIVKGATFKLPRNTCKIKLGVYLDAMTRSSYTLKVSYKISGHTIASGSTIVHVKVVDFNNHAPEFLSSSHYVEISEDLAVNSDVYQVNVKDGDLGNNGKLTFWLMNDSSNFKIDPNSGMISVKQVSDRDTGTAEFAYLVVRVADNGSPIRLEKETVVTIKIKARNDNAPVIKQDSCEIKLPPLFSVDKQLVQIEAIDIDVDADTKIYYSLTSGNTNNMFTIDSSSGYVSLVKPLSGFLTSFDLEVSADDGTRKSLNHAVLRIRVDKHLKAKDVFCTISNMYLPTLELKQIKVAKDPARPVITSRAPQNTYAPKFSKKVLTITVFEDEKVGTLLETLKAVDNDNGNEGFLTYYSVGDKPSNYFSVDALTGELRLAAALDWESVSRHELNVSAWDCGVSRKVGFVKVIIIVEDVVDNPPRFSHRFYNVSVEENSGHGTIVKLLSRGTLVSKGFTFKLINDYNKLFSLDSRYGGLNLITNKHLDYEEQSVYELQVLVVDKSLANKPAPQVDVIVNVIDVNDNYPLVYKSNPQVIMRDLQVGSPITQITAIDADPGSNGVVKFALTKNWGIFSIDSNTGLIKLSKSLIRKTRESYNLSITVSDGGKSSLITSTFVDIIVIERNGGHNLKSSSEISQYVVNENLPAGHEIAELGGIDTPFAKANKYFFSIIDGTDVTMFNITGTFGYLKTTGPLDREKVPYYWLTIQVINAELRHLHSIMHILIKVKDENDNLPIFYPPVYESSMPENSKPGEFVVAVSAKDADSGVNGNLSYSIIHGNSQGHFDINASSGIITTTEVELDYESRRMLRVIVSVTDGGNPKNTNQATVTIYVHDENDNRPTFLAGQTVEFFMFGKLSLPTNTLLGQVFAHDKDSGKNSALTFRIVSGNVGGKLRIDSASGLLYNSAVISELDAFQLVIEAKDGGQPSLTSTTTVNVFSQTAFVTFGRNRPEFPDKAVDIILSENTQVRHEIVIEEAVDKDFDSLSYFICAGNEKQKFKIKNFRNILQVVDQLEPPSYQLIIGATDGLYSGNFTLRIKINDINNHYPIPQMTEKIATIPENALPGTKVAKVLGKYSKIL